MSPGGLHRVYFNHVTKCAGTSIGEMLGLGFRAEEIYSTNQGTPASIRFVPFAPLHAKGLIWGHFGDWARQRSPGRYSIISLREPWSRFRSLLRHAARDAGIFAAGPLRAYMADPSETVLRSEEFSEAISASSQILYLLNPETLGRVKPAPVGGRELDEALENLELYDLVFTEETIDDAARHLADGLGLPPVGSAPRLNSSDQWPDSQKFDPPASHADRMGEVFEFDRAVFARASEIALAHREVYRRSPDEYAARYRESLAAAPRGSSWSLDWADPVRCRGWSARNRPQIEGYEARWSRLLNGRSGLIDCPLIPSAPMLVEAVMWATDPATYERLRVRVGSGEPAWSRLLPIRNNPNLHVWRGHVRDGVEEPATRIEFDVQSDAQSERAQLWLLDLHIRPA